MVDPPRYPKHRHEILELETQGDLFDQCSPTLVTQCVILFLPRSSWFSGLLTSTTGCDQACRERHLETASQVKSDLRGKPWGWLWVELGTQIELEKALGGVKEAQIVVVKFGRGTSWRKILEGSSDGDKEQNSERDLTKWLKRISKDKEKGEAKIQKSKISLRRGVPLPKIQF